MAEPGSDAGVDAAPDAARRVETERGPTRRRRRLVGPYSEPDCGRGGFELTAGREPARRVLGDVWRSRDLVAMLARQDFHVRYRRASLGVLWAVGLPVIQAVVLAIVFSKVVKVPAGGNYGTFLFAGVLPWTFFSAVITGAATSIVDGQSLATKIYFPRAVLPLVTVASNLYGYVPSVGVLVVFAVTFGAPVSPSWLLLVPGTVLMIALTASLAMVLAALQVYFRDVRYIVTVLVLVWFYATPVIYPLRLAHGVLHGILELNPVTGVVEVFRAAVLHADPGWGATVVWTGVWALVLLAAGLELHRRFDRVFVDLL